MAAAAPEGCCALATTCAVLPAARASVAGDTFSDVMPVGSAVTVIAAADVSVVDVKPVPVPVAVTVMVATPGPTAVTTPAADTVATEAVDEAYVYATATAAAPLFTVGTIVTVWLTCTFAALGETCRPLIAAAGAATETEAAAD